MAGAILSVLNVTHLRSQGLDFWWQSEIRLSLGVRFAGAFQTIAVFS